ncbi:hypothetical protein M9H77_06871 [Catharanthus roseus]|uniref:Uncharacterized protein n=1 Tax=Catharanthus roseus TaxID=4058 RepID=A0ACC0BTF1_CATRO|nr:hypothetical protein M9H77_06871 [Catharanthus roseus]
MPLRRSKWTPAHLVLTEPNIQQVKEKMVLQSTLREPVLLRYEEYHLSIWDSNPLCANSSKPKLCNKLSSFSASGNMTSNDAKAIYNQSTSQHIAKSRRQFLSLGKKGFQLSTKVNFQFLTYSKIRILLHKVLDIKI